MNQYCFSCAFQDDCESEKECLLEKINKTNFSLKKDKINKFKKYKKERQLREER